MSGRRLRSRRASTVLAAVLTCGLPVISEAGALTVTAGQSEIIFDEHSGTPQRWVICAPDCNDDHALRNVLLAENNGYMRITTPSGPGGVFNAVVEETDDAVIIRFTAATERYTYRLSRKSPLVMLEIQAQARVEFATGASFIPNQLPGFGQLYSRVNAVQLSEQGQVIFDGSSSVQADSTNWTGVRNRYWALLAQPQDMRMMASLGLPETDRPVVTLSSAPESHSTVINLFAGPIERDILAPHPLLEELLFGALAEFFRVLCFGMLILLDLLYGLVGNYGISIILLSLVVKILMSPLTAIAERWQQDVNRIQTLLRPGLDEIRRHHRGEKAHKLTLELYKRHDVSLWYTTKSAAGFLLQIPIFIAAFDMLAENFALSETAFLWINDLSRPDALLQLPFNIPFFGDSLNLLPFLMAGLSILAAWLQSNASLSPDLLREQRRRLYLMSAAFFLLFYTFPAGMVLYWTSSNLFHLLKMQLVNR